MVPGGFPELALVEGLVFGRVPPHAVGRLHQVVAQVGVAGTAQGLMFPFELARGMLPPGEAEGQMPAVEAGGLQPEANPGGTGGG